MRPDSSPWRVSDAVAYDVVLRAVDRFVAGSDEDPVDVVRGASRVSDTFGWRSAVLGTDGFDRAAVAKLTLPGDRPSAEGSRSGAAQVLTGHILPAVFSGASAVETPRFVLLGGQAGSGRSRAIGRIRGAEGDGMAVVSADLLRAYAASGEEEPASAGSWLLACMRHARERRVSLLLDGSFPAADAVSGVLEAFESDGYATQVAVVAIPRAESLLAAASAYAIERQSGLPSELPSLAKHDAEWRETQALMEALASRRVPVRTTVFDRVGAVVFDAGSGAESVRAFDGAADSPMSTLQAVQWLSELRRVTQYAQHPATHEPELIKYLVAAHEAAIREVIPGLRVPTHSQVAPTLESRLASDLVSLRRSAQATGPEAASPQMAPPVGADGPRR